MPHSPLQAVGRENKNNFVGFLASRSLQKVFSQSAPIRKLLETLEQTQIEPNRWDPLQLHKRRPAFPPTRIGNWH